MQHWIGITGQWPIDILGSPLYLQGNEMYYITLQTKYLSFVCVPIWFLKLSRAENYGIFPIGIYNSMHCNFRYINSACPCSIPSKYSYNNREKLSKPLFRISIQITTLYCYAWHWMTIDKGKLRRSSFCKKMTQFGLNTFFSCINDQIDSNGSRSFWEMFWWETTAWEMSRWEMKLF